MVPTYIENCRPCFVDGEKALFHGWFEVSQLVCESLIKGGHPAGTVCGVLGLVEMKDGTMREVSSQRIKFVGSEKLFDCFDYSEENKN